MTDDRVVELLDLIIYKMKDGYGNLNQSVTSNAREARAIMLNRARIQPPPQGEHHGRTTTTQQ